MEDNQRRKIFGLSKALSMTNDDLHALICGVTGVSSIKELDDVQTAAVIVELSKRCSGNNAVPHKSKKTESVAGMMTGAQQSLAWRYIYRLQELDKSPSKALPGERMCGAIKKILKVDAAPKEPFKWISFDDGAKLIEMLKRYVRSAEKKAGG